MTKYSSHGQKRSKCRCAHQLLTGSEWAGVGNQTINTLMMDSYLNLWGRIRSEGLSCVSLLWSGETTDVEAVCPSKDTSTSPLLTPPATPPASLVDVAAGCSPHHHQTLALLCSLWTCCHPQGEQGTNGESVQSGVLQQIWLHSNGVWTQGPHLWMWSPYGTLLQSI